MHFGGELSPWTDFELHLLRRNWHAEKDQGWQKQKVLSAAGLDGISERDETVEPPNGVLGRLDWIQFRVLWFGRTAAKR
jgi:hypothetical protein